MAFSATDIITASGSNFLYNDWTNRVTKYDTSSFYNWEQDNEPLYDLEERTYELWEQAGFPTSSLNGMSLAVSADATASDLLNNTNLFTTVSACMAALPQVIRFPIFVEVAGFGDIGGLELHNIKFAENGSLEIINRGYARIYKSEVVDNLTHATAAEPYAGIYATQATNGAGLFDSSCLSLSSVAVSSTADARAGDGAVFITPVASARVKGLAVTLGGDSVAAWAGGVLGSNSIYDHNPTYDGTVQILDASNIDPWTSVHLKKRVDDFSNGANTTTGSYYLNTLSKLSVKNCEGPIYIRNFCVYGDAGVGGTGTDTGIHVQNSNVQFDNQAVALCNHHGFLIENSHVTLSRSSYAYRIYERPTSTTRVDKQGYGLLARNSTVTLQDGNDIQSSGDDVVFVFGSSYGGVKLENSNLVGGMTRTDPLYSASGGSFRVERNTHVGLTANNSNIELEGLVDVWNNYTGINLVNSTFTYEDLCVENNSKIGLHAVGSNLTWDGAKSFTATGQTPRRQMDFLHNGQDIVLDGGSKLGFKRSVNMPDTFGHTAFVSSIGQLDLSGSSRPTTSVVVMGNSKAEFLHTIMNPKGQDNTHTTAGAPIYGLAAKAKDGSEINFYGTGSGCTFIMGTPLFAYQQKVAGVYATNNSKIGVHGPTVVGQFGIDFLVEKNSTLDMSPPMDESSDIYDLSGFSLDQEENHSSVELHSTRSCIVAKDNSVVRLADLGDYANCWSSDRISTAGYRTDNLGTSALTKFGSLQFFPNPQNAALCASGSDPVESAWDGIDGFHIMSKLAYNNQYLCSNDMITSPSFSEISSLTLGGMCVRLVGDSVAEVKNVHFPTGTEDNALNKIYFDASGDTCHRLMIWNIADTSRLKASHLSVSGSYPGDAGYYGPSALWIDSGGLVASGAPAGTPNTGKLSILDSYGSGSAVYVLQPGTSINEPFDRFYPYNASDAGIYTTIAEGGLVVSAGDTYLYGSSAVGTFANQGVFRLYFSVAPEAKYLTATNADEVGIPMQVFAQGYNFSGTLSALDLEGVADSMAVSALAQNLLKLSLDSDADGIPNKLATSGFYYCSEFVENNPTQCILDESASDSFANAKNCALGGSGRPKKVTIYRSRLSTNRASDSYSGDNIAGVRSVNVFDLENDN